jgi:competence protein ComEA
MGLGVLLLLACSHVGSGYLRGQNKQQLSNATAFVSTARPRVQVVGAVKRPGVYVFGDKALVKDAIAAAGGATEDADVAGLDLQAVLRDGTQLVVPAKGFSAQGIYAIGGHAPARAASPPSARTKEELAPGSISINQADASELDRLPGVGPAIAQRIIDHRSQRGPFRTIDDLQQVKGIGPKKMAQIRPYVRL